MCRTNAARCEDIGVFCAQRIHGLDNLVFHVGHDPGLPDGNTERRKIGSNLLQIDVARPTGEQLVPDQEDGCRGRFFCHKDTLPRLAYSSSAS